MGHAELQLEWYELTLKVVAARISEERNTKISSEKIGLALAELNGFSQNLQVFWHVLDNGLKIYDEVKDFSFGEVLVSIELYGDECILPKGIPVHLYEKQIKVKGQIWELHKNDADPFPSDPHAHNYETGLKLDLSNGNLYKKKKYTDSITKKTLLVIRDKYTEAGFTMPTLTVWKNNERTTAVCSNGGWSASMKHFCKVQRQ